MSREGYGHSRVAKPVDPNFNLFPVNLTQTGGSAGTDPPSAGVAGTLCTFTYDAIDKRNAARTLDTKVAVEKDRMFPVKMTAATKGVAYWKNGFPKKGDLVIWDCNEVPDSGPC